jgi:hypothetical protein
MFIMIEILFNIIEIFIEVFIIWNIINLNIVNIINIINILNIKIIIFLK